MSFFRKKCDPDKELRSERLEIYKIMIEMADRVSARRQASNNFFLSINTALVGGSTFFQIKATQIDTIFMISISGFIICVLWARAINSYRNLNRAKFIVIHDMEKRLAFRPYTDEWSILDPDRDGRKYAPFYRIERIVPWTFIVIYLFQTAKEIPWSTVLYSIAAELA